VSDIELKHKNSKEQEFIQKTQNDEMLGKVLEYCKSVWPKTTNEDGELKHYWKLRNEIISNIGLLYYQTRLLIPKVLRNYILTNYMKLIFGLQR